MKSLKSAALHCGCFLLLWLMAGEARAQFSNDLNKQLLALITTDISAIKGKEKQRKGDDAVIYASRLPLTGFEVTYAETRLGNELRATYLKPASMAVMDALAEKFIELPYARLDSKKDKRVLGSAIYATSLQRKIKLVDLEGHLYLSAELSSDNRLTLFFHQ